MVLRRDHFIAVGNQQLDDLAETGSVGPQAMCEDNAGFAGHATPTRTVTFLKRRPYVRPAGQERTGELPAGSSVGEYRPPRSRCKAMTVSSSSTRTVSVSDATLVAKRKGKGWQEVFKKSPELFQEGR